jgi:predicted glycoside hydrolase/deacetylase ChbG (UPF0249 family)
MTRTRSLLVIADDFGIGPETSRGILDLAALGRVTGTVLLVNSPFAGQSMQAWRAADCPLEIGWHPCLTLDRPLLPPRQVPSLVDDQGRFLSLGRFLYRATLGKIDPAHVDKELRAQLDCFIGLAGSAPRLVNFHHHLHVFSPVDCVLLKILSELEPRPYLRRVSESPAVLCCVPGGRLKRLFLSWHGWRSGAALAAAGLPTNDTLAGISTPGSVLDPNYLVRWLNLVKGEVVELTCHPGHRDETLIGRDCTADDGRVEARVEELERLRDASFAEVCRQTGLVITKPREILERAARSARHAA